VRKLTEVVSSARKVVYKIYILRVETSDVVHAHVIVKLPHPGDSEVNFTVFESSCHNHVITNLTTQRW